MGQSKGRAKRLLRELPTDPSLLLARSAYWKPEFLQLFFDHVDGLIFDDPIAAQPWAAVAPQLALLVPEGEGVEARLRHREGMAMGHAILGGAFRSVSKHGLADAEYRTAYRLAESEGASRLFFASLDTRLATLRGCQNRIDDSERLTLGAIQTFREHRDNQGAAQALAVRGYVFNESGRFSDAIPCFVEVLNLADQKQSARVHHSAVHNLAVAILSAPTAPLDAVRKQIRSARKLLRAHRDGVPRHKLGWLEGLFWLRKGMHNRSIRALDVARRGFVRLALPYEVALVSLDLAGVHYFCESYAEAGMVAGSAYEHVTTLEADREAIVVLRLWLEAVRTQKLTEVITTATRQMVESRIGPHGCCRSKRRSA